jgi:phosphate transporter
VVRVLVFRQDPSNPGHPLPAEEAANECLGSLVNHTTMLILGGYAVSAAFSRCEIELQIASFLQRRLGDRCVGSRGAAWKSRPSQAVIRSLRCRRPKLFMLAMMFLGLFLSAVISNHTSPVLCLSIINPIIKDFDPKSRYTKALLLGIAYACNFGGMMTPISSMQVRTKPS